MIKKLLLPLVLVLLLLTVMSTGSLAIYSQAKTIRGRIYTRVFLFHADEKSTSYDLGLSGLALAPGSGEKELYRFELSNTSKTGQVSNYPISASISSTGMAQALSGMDGLVFRLYNVTSESNIPVATLTGGELSYSGISFAGDSRQSLQYKLTAQWNDTGNSEAQTALAASGKCYEVSLKVTATATE